MNIGIVTTWFERGAAYVSRQFEEVLQQKYNIFIFARGGEKYAKGDPNWDHKNVFWSTRNARFMGMWYSKKEFVKWAKDNKIDAVIFNEQQNFTPVTWAKELGLLTIAYIDYYTEETVPLFDIYDGLICNTKRHYSAFEDLGNAYYIPWGTDVDLYKPTNEGLVNKGKVTFFNSAGMNPLRKGTDTFIKALDKCKDLDFKAVIQSQKTLHSYFPELDDTIKNLMKNGKLEVIEKTVPAPGLYYKADVYVYPSILDGIGLTVCEAVSSGLACITSDNPPMSEFVEPQYGSLIPINRLWARSDGYYWPQCRCDVDGLAKILKVYIENPQEVIKKKKAAREWALSHFSFKDNAQSLFGIIESMKKRPYDEALLRKIYLYDNKQHKLKLQRLWDKLGIYKFKKEHIASNIR